MAPRSRATRCWLNRTTSLLLHPASRRVVRGSIDGQRGPRRRSAHSALTVVDGSGASRPQLDRASTKAALGEEAADRSVRRVQNSGDRRARARRFSGPGEIASTPASSLPDPCERAHADRFLRGAPLPTARAPVRARVAHRATRISQHGDRAGVGLPHASATRTDAGQRDRRCASVRLSPAAGYGS